MNSETQFDVIVVGGSYSGLAAAMALGRALRKVLVIDAGKPCNAPTPYSHNFLTHDGRPPAEIAAMGKAQVQKYASVEFLEDDVVGGSQIEGGFAVHTASGKTFSARKLIFATGIKDLMPAIAGFEECWGISVLHCPYCHGYEVRDQPTGILANGDLAMELVSLLLNWTNDLRLFTNGPSTLTLEQAQKLTEHGVAIVETEIERLEQVNGVLQTIILRDGTFCPMPALYARLPFEQHCRLPQDLGCELNELGYIKVDALQRTSVPGVFASGDNTTAMRTVANAVAMGTAAGMMVNKELILEDF